jgi:hypothetical protein
MELAWSGMLVAAPAPGFKRSNIVGEDFDLWMHVKIGPDDAAGRRLRVWQQDRVGLLIAVRGKPS